MPLPLNPAILVAYATSTGTTREIAERIASTLQTTTSWRVDCKPVAEIPSLHKELHCRPQRPTPAPAAQPATAVTTPPAAAAAETANGAATEDHTIHPNPLSALITPEPQAEPESEPPVEYKAIIVGSSIHAGKWISSGRSFITHNKDFFAGGCCNNKQAGAATRPVKGGWATLWGVAQQQQKQKQNPQHEESTSQQQQQQQTGVQEDGQRGPAMPMPKIYAFSVGMPGNDDALSSEQASVEAALRKAVGRRTKLVPVSDTTNSNPMAKGDEGKKKEEEEEVLEKHILFRGMWSPRQIEILAPRVVTRVLKWCIPADSKFMEEDDERDWKGIEGWASGVGKEIMGSA